MAASRANRNGRRGLLGERHAAASYGLERVADEESPDYYDALAREDVVEAGVVVLQAGTPVDAKVARVRYDDRAGRIKLRRPNHERLVDEGGAYAVVVVDDADRVLASTLVRAADVDDLVTEWWSPGRSRRDRGEYVQIPWTRLLAADMSELETMTESLEGDD